MSEEKEVVVLKPQEILEKEIASSIEVMFEGLGLNPVPSKSCMAVDVGTSKTRGVPFSSNSNTVSIDNIIHIQNQYAILDENDVKDALKFDFEVPSFVNRFLVKLTNTTNLENPFFNEELIISKGLVSEKLLKGNSYSVSNTAKYAQAKEYIVNAYSIIISQMMCNVVKFLEKGDVESAQKALNVELNLAFMLPDEEKQDPEAMKLAKALEGTVDFELPLFNGLKGRFTLKGFAPNQYLEMYGEGESVVYYFLIKNGKPEYKDAYTNHGVAVIDMGEGSLENVFFKKKEIIEGASSTERTINGLTLINRTVRNIKEDPNKNRFVKPTVNNIKAVLEENGELKLKTPVGDYDIASALTKAKKDLAGDVVNKFKNALEETTVLEVGDIFLVILAGRSMTDNEHSPSFGKFIVERMEDQLNIPSSICHVTHPDANLIGAALKLLLKMKKASK